MESPADGAPTAADIDDLIALVTGSHTAKVYLDGESARLQVLDQLGERNVYVDGEANEVWYVDSETQTATQLTLPSDAGIDQLHSDAPDPQDSTLTPDQMLDQALADLDETTEVTVGTDARVAGRDVYELVLTPRTEDTLVGEVRFAIDGENGVALAASVTARGASRPGVRDRVHPGRLLGARPGRLRVHPWRRHHGDREGRSPCRPGHRNDDDDDGCRIPRRLRRGLVGGGRTAQHARRRASRACSRGSTPSSSRCSTASRPPSTADGCCRHRSSAC